MRWAVTILIVSIALWVGYKEYKAYLMECVMGAYDLTRDQVQDKSISELRLMLKTLKNQKP